MKLGRKLKRVMKMSIRHTPVTIEPFQELYEKEKQARDLYDSYIKKLKNKELIQMFSFIKKQEEGHMEIAKKLIELVE